MQALIKLQFPNLQYINRHMIPPPGYLLEEATADRVVDLASPLTQKRRKTETNNSSDNRVSIWSNNGSTSRSSSSDSSSDGSDNDSGNNIGWTGIQSIGYPAQNSGSGSKKRKRSGGWMPQLGTAEHAVSRLEEMRPQTHYDLVKVKGPPHAQIFVVSVTVDGTVSKLPVQRTIKQWC